MMPRHLEGMSDSMENTWLCESIRVSALGRAPELVSELDWKAVMGSDPEQRETQPRLGTVREIGPVLGGAAVLEFRASAGRVDWALAPIIPPDIQLPTIPNVGSVTEAIRNFRDLIFEHVTRSYAASRFAFGMAAFHQQPTGGASYEELAALLHNAALLAPGTSDFVYQINRPRNSKSVNGLVVNRLSRWSSIAVHGLRLQITAPLSNLPESLLSSSSPTLQATRAEFDINSSAERREPIPAEMRRLLLDEFVELAEELLSAGDVP
jgi:hypothetical protein